MSYDIFSFKIKNKVIKTIYFLLLKNHFTLSKIFHAKKMDSQCWGCSSDLFEAFQENENFQLRNLETNGQARQLRRKESSRKKFPKQNNILSKWYSPQSRG